MLLDRLRTLLHGKLELHLLLLRLLLVFLDFHELALQKLLVRRVHHIEVAAPVDGAHFEQRIRFPPMEQKA